MFNTSIQTKIQSIIESESGLDQNRDYLGISKIGDCPRKIYREFFNGVSLTEEAHRFCYAGYHQEDDIWRMLVNLGIAKDGTRNMEVVSSFDKRFKGHIDGLSLDKRLIEIKSVSSSKFESILEKGKALYKHFVQIQLYMKYLVYTPGCILIYRNRETYEHIVIDVPYLPNEAEKLEGKARRLLQAIDAKEIPACECKYCKD